MVVLFLDIDGVLNSDRYFDIRSPEPSAGQAIGAWDIDPVAVQRLNRVVEATGAIVVLSSDWRKTDAGRPGVTDTQNALCIRGATFDIHSSTPVLTTEERIEYFGVSWSGNYTPRGFEIQRWLDEHPEVERFAIVDDDADMRHLSERLVQTDTKIGLSDADCGALVALLSGEKRR
jgi:hypothetical protein